MEKNDQSTATKGYTPEKMLRICAEVIMGPEASGPMNKQGEEAIGFFVRKIGEVAPQVVVRNLLTH